MHLTLKIFKMELMLITRMNFLEVFELQKCIRNLVLVPVNVTINTKVCRLKFLKNASRRIF